MTRAIKQFFNEIEVTQNQRYKTFTPVQCLRARRGDYPRRGVSLDAPQS
jgi:hypothetical protein